MIELVITACLIANPAKCDTQHIFFDDRELTQMQCFIVAPQEIAKWSERRPKWQVKKWSCEKSMSHAKSI